MKLFNGGPRWWPMAAIALVSVATTLVIWRALSLEQQAQVQRMTRLAAESVEADLRDDIASRVLAQTLFAGMWDEPDAEKTEWQRNARLLLRRYPECQKVEWVAPNYHVRLTYPEPANASERSYNVTGDPALRPVLRRALSSSQPMVFLGPSSQDKDGILLRRLVVPLYNHGSFHGFVIATVDVRKALETMLSDHVGLGYSITISEDGQELYRTAGASAAGEQVWGQDIDIVFPETTWRAHVWPTPALLAGMKSRLPEVALLAGSLLCVLLMLTVQFADKSRTKSRELETANQQLRSEVAVRMQAEQAARESQMRLAEILETCPDAIISIDEKQVITLFNEGAEKTFGYKAEEILGRNLNLLIPEQLRSAHPEHVGRLAERPDKPEFTCGRANVLGLHKDGRQFPVEASLSRLSLNGQTIFTAILRDITERVKAEAALRRAHDELEMGVLQRTAELARTNRNLQAEIAERTKAETSLRELSGRLLQLQDEERRRIARELHDSTSQNLAALAMNISRLHQAIAPEDRARAVLDDCVSLVDQCSSEIRTISYLLHPPLLDELGLASALRWAATGFSKRSGIEVKLEVATDLGRFAREIEVAMFRIVQEALTNIHRHSRSRTATITASCDTAGLTVTIVDEGCGLPMKLLHSEGNGNGQSDLGVGIAGMRERMHQLGGTLEIDSTNGGTRITARVPLMSSTVSANAS